MQKSYLTYNKVINLLCTFFYFYEWHDHHPSYLKAKYYSLFYNLPDKISVKRGKIISDYVSSVEMDILNFMAQLPHYEKKWGKLTNEEILICFSTFYLSNNVLTCDKLVSRYSDLYSSYSFINEESQKIGLHTLHKIEITKYEEKYKKELNVFNRISKINKLYDGLDTD